MLRMILLQVKDPKGGLLKASDQMGPTRERKGASHKVRVLLEMATVFLLALKCS